MEKERDFLDDFFEISHINYEYVKNSEYFKNDEFLKELGDSIYLEKLEDQTQVTQRFLSEKDVSTRLTHTYQVMKISEFISDVRGLDKKTAIRIAAFHDTGHTPFGHIGERTIAGLIELNVDNKTILSHFIGEDQQENMKRYLNFKHNITSCIVFEKIARENNFLNNIEYEVIKDGILNHSGDFFKAKTEEGKSVSLADKLAYLTQDLEDAEKVGFHLDYPKDLGNNPREILKNILDNIVLNKNNEKFLDDEIIEKINILKKYMYENFYASNDLKKIDKFLGNILQWMFVEWYDEVNELREDIDEGIRGHYYEYYYDFFKIKKDPNELKSMLDFNNSLLQFITLTDMEVISKESFLSPEEIKETLKRYKDFEILDRYEFG